MYYSNLNFEIHIEANKCCVALRCNIHLLLPQKLVLALVTVSWDIKDLLLCNPICLILIQGYKIRIRLSVSKSFHLFQLQQLNLLLLPRWLPPLVGHYFIHCSFFPISLSLVTVRAFLTAVTLFLCCYPIFLNISLAGSMEINSDIRINPISLEYSLSLKSSVE